MSWYDECERSTLELCNRNLCYHCCRYRHECGVCDKYEGEWETET